MLQIKYDLQKNLSNLEKHGIALAQAHWLDMKKKLITPTAEEEAQINKGIAADPDTYELSDDEFKQLRPFRGRPPSTLPLKQMTTIRLDADVMLAFKAHGPGWQTRINNALKQYLQEHPLIDD